MSTRRIIYYNPPYSRNVSTKVGGTMFFLPSKHFPPEHPLHQILNRNYIKMSYCCMSNMKSLISRSNNAKVRNAAGTEASNDNRKGANCSCENQSNCPLDGQCNTEFCVYKADVITESNVKSYC